MLDNVSLHTNNMFGTFRLLTILQIIITNVYTTLSDVSTSPSSTSMEAQIIRILNQESLLRLELEKKIHDLEAKVETLKSTTDADRKTIANLSNHTHQDFHQEIQVLKGKVGSLESTVQSDKVTIRNLNSVLANVSRQAEDQAMKHEKELFQLKTRTANNSQSLLHLSSAIMNVSTGAGQRLQNLEQTIPILARKQPSVGFLVHLSDNIRNHPGAVIFDIANLNIGNAYNTRTGIFTTPVDGIYSFSVSLTGEDGDVHGYIRKNGRNFGYVFADDMGSSQNRRASISVTLHCNKGDDVWFHCIDNGDDEIHGFGYTWFSGHLVSMD